MKSIKTKLRYIIGNAIGFILFGFAISKRKLKKENHILSIYFHNPSINLFEKCIKYLSNHSFTFISSEKLESVLKEKKVLTEKYVHITIDDGWKDNLKLVPLIEKYKVFLTLFITTDPIIDGNFWWEYCRFLPNQSFKNLTKEKLKKMPNSDRLNIVSELKKTSNLSRSAMTLEDLVDFSKNPFVTIGSHTVSHPITIMCSDDELETEYSESKALLQKWLNTEVKYFAYPNGDFNSRDIILLQKHNYKMAYAINNEPINLETNLYKIPRITIDDDKGFYENMAKMFGIWFKLKALFK
jgi:poly-beta-1,6-N-acetyl-D-glucosamine N-deacetylase